LFGIISLLIKLDSPGPVFYFHERLSFQGRPIRIIKFRTMVDGADKRLSDEEKREFEKQYKLKKDWRVTPLGRTLRRISLDELPQLINSLKGDISIVGPRPIVYKELEKYGDDAEKFLSVKPGLTGFWQAYGRGDVDYETRRRLELRYVEEASIWLDIKILFKTVEQIVLRGGV
jgi:lipopolysaccharide/colanic/teichoic acid biosynthesis glycosyltransferase